MKTTTVLKNVLFIGLAASVGFAQAPASRSKWIPLPPKTAAQPSTQAGAAAALMAALTPEKRANSKDRGTVQDRLALQQTLPGTWLMHITPQGDDAPPPFIALGQFSWDGNFLSTESDLYEPPAGTPGQGVWAPAPSGGFDLMFYAFLFDGGDLLGMSKVRAHGQIGQGATSFKGTYKVEFFDVNGVVLFSGTGTFDGVPVAVEPL